VVQSVKQAKLLIDLHIRIAHAVEAAADY